MPKNHKIFSFALVVLAAFLSAPSITFAATENPFVTPQERYDASIEAILDKRSDESEQGAPDSGLRFPEENSEARADTQPDPSSDDETDSESDNRRFIGNVNGRDVYMDSDRNVYYED